MYDNLSKRAEAEIMRMRAANDPLAFDDGKAIRRTDNPHDRANALRSNFIRDIDKIIYCPYFSRYQDKTQVFSLYRNDDITRRWLHVQFVAQIARTIGKALGLNTELITAIALGHDIGHTPFGHAGENVLDELSLERTGKRFYHNLNSVRVLDEIFPTNLTLQTLDGILCHNGESEEPVYRPQEINSFAEFDELTAAYAAGKPSAIKKMPATLEGCVVRIADIIAYLGKDRQDAEKTIAAKEKDYFVTEIGSFNAEMINNLTVNIIENSVGKPYIGMDKEYFEALRIAKRENYQRIYNAESTTADIKDNLRPMFTALYDRFYDDLTKGDRKSFVFAHHVDQLDSLKKKRATPYEQTDPDRIVIDYLSSMTDDYFIDVYKKLFPESGIKLGYKSYFE